MKELEQISELDQDSIDYQNYLLDMSDMEPSFPSNEELELMANYYGA